MKYSRGYDLKMMTSAYVIAIVKDINTVKFNQLKQMIGRSSREQGVPIGVILAAKAPYAKMLPTIQDIKGKG